MQYVKWSSWTKEHSSQRWSSHRMIMCHANSFLLATAMVTTSKPKPRIRRFGFWPQTQTLGFEVWVFGTYHCNSDEADSHCKTQTKTQIPNPDKNDLRMMKFAKFGLKQVLTLSHWKISRVRERREFAKCRGHVPAWQSTLPVSWQSTARPLSLQRDMWAV